LQYFSISQSSKKRYYQYL